MISYLKNLIMQNFFKFQYQSIFINSESENKGFDNHFFDLSQEQKVFQMVKSINLEGSTKYVVKELDLIENFYENYDTKFWFLFGEEDDEEEEEEDEIPSKIIFNFFL